MAITIDSARGIFPGTLSADAVPALTARFNQLSAEDQLAWTWLPSWKWAKRLQLRLQAQPVCNLLKQP